MHQYYKWFKEINILQIYACIHIYIFYMITFREIKLDAVENVGKEISIEITVFYECILCT